MTHPLREFGFCMESNGPSNGLTRRIYRRAAPSIILGEIIHNPRSTSSAAWGRIHWAAQEAEIDHLRPERVIVSFGRKAIIDI